MFKTFYHATYDKITCNKTNLNHNNVDNGKCRITFEVIHIS